MKNSDFIRCSICGTENDKKAEFCEDCGAKLSESAAEKKSEKKQNAKSESKKESKKQSHNKNAKKVKAIDPVKLTYLIVVLVIVGGAILYSSGIFDQPSAPAVTNQVPNDEFHRGADLSKLQEINSLRDQVTNNPADHQSMLHLAHLLNDSGFKEEAIKWYKQYLQDHQQEADVWVDMGVCYFDMNNFDQAISSMKKGIELNPQHQIAHFNLGIVYYTSGNLNEAISWWNKAIELNPSSDIASRARELITNNTNM
jgi:tetratricopeptide (TPR) repeat protein